MSNFPVLGIRSPQNVLIEYELASLGERIAAQTIDIAIMLGASYGTAELIELLGKKFEISLSNWMLIILFIPILTYPFWCELLNNGQTAGKYFLKTKVIKTDGSQPGISNYLARWMFLLLDFSFFPAVGDIILMILNKHSRRAGDWVADTTVIRLRYKTKFEDTIFRNLRSDYNPTFHQVINLKDRDINIITGILVSDKRSDHHDRMVKVADKIKEVLQIHSDLPTQEFLTRILDDYNFLTGKEVN